MGGQTDYNAPSSRGLSLAFPGCHMPQSVVTETLMKTLTGKQRRFLRGLGHHLQPVVMIGKDELTEALVVAVEEALDAHELIKVKLQDGCLLDRKDAAERLAKRTSSAIAQILGKTILLYRAAEEPVITLPG